MSVQYFAPAMRKVRQGIFKISSVALEEHTAYSSYIMNVNEENNT